MIRIILVILSAYLTPIKTCDVSQVGCVMILTEYIATHTDFIDTGGTWTVVSVPAGSNITNANLFGSDDPCVTFDQCGIYIFNYEYESSTCGGCIMNTNVPFERCCLPLTGTCTIN